VRQLLLAGCGHAHLFVLESLARDPLPGVRAVLVSSADEYFYSGMIPGVVAGRYPPEDARFLPPRLAERAGAEWVRDTVIAVDAHGGRARLRSGGTLPFDLVSFDIGSRLAGDQLPGVREHAVPVKPMRDALDMLRRAEEAVRGAREHAVRFVITGGGAAGVELAFCLHARFAPRLRDRLDVTVLHGGRTLLPEHREATRERARRLLRRRGMRVRCSATVVACTAEYALLETGERVPYDLLIWATGPRAPAELADSGLTCDERGYLRVAPTLRSPTHPNVFGAGDCVSIDGYPWVPKAGVYAVREGPVLAENLRNALAGRPLTRYTPQRHWLSLMNLGDGRALLSYRGRSTHGRLAWWLKDRIDRRFMRRFQQLP
jgi:selenide, water dikinase